MSPKPELFEKLAHAAGARRAALARACAEGPVVLALVPDEPEWDVAHRVIAAAEYLRLRGDAGDDPIAAIHEHPGFVRDFVREPRALMVVFQTISTIYLPLPRRLRVKELLAAAKDVVFIETPTPEEHNLRGWRYPLAVDGKVLAEMDSGATWLRWIGDG